MDNINKELGLPAGDSVKVVKTLIGIIKSTLESGEDLLISGFGEFCVNERGETLPPALI